MNYKFLMNKEKGLFLLVYLCYDINKNRRGIGISKKVGDVMKFQRINEDTIRCIVYKQDMQEYGIVLEDFFKDKRKIHDFLHQIVERAEQEIGYIPKEGMLSMQIIPINANMISITFSENMGNDYESIMNHLRSTLENGPQKDEDEEIEYLEDEEEELQGFGPDSFEEYQPGAELCRHPEKISIVMIVMDSIQQMADYCRMVGVEKTVTSELYYLESRDVYCLIIEKNRLSENDMRKMLMLAVEYTSDIIDDMKIICYVREHGEPVIEKSAYRILKQYV